MVEGLVGIEGDRRGADWVSSFGELEFEGEEVEDSGELEEDGVGSRIGRGRLAYSFPRLKERGDLMSQV